jgi:hypothetical protein
MNDDNTQDGAEPSLASAGSQPVAIMSWEQADQIIQDQRAEIERLRVNLRLADAGFTLGSPTLTDEEKEAIALAKSRLGTSDRDWQANDVLVALLKRLG